MSRKNININRLKPAFVCQKTNCSFDLHNKNWKESSFSYLTGCVRLAGELWSKVKDNLFIYLIVFIYMKLKRIETTLLCCFFIDTRVCVHSNIVGTKMCFLLCKNCIIKFWIKVCYYTYHNLEHIFLFCKCNFEQPPLCLLVIHYTIFSVLMRFKRLSVFYFSGVFVTLCHVRLPFQNWHFPMKLSFLTMFFTSSLSLYAKFWDTMYIRISYEIVSPDRFFL